MPSAPPAPETPPRLRDPLLLCAAAALTVAFWGLQLAQGPSATVDELFSPTAAVLLEAGLPVRADLLMLTDFCGGCAVSTSLARGLFAVLPPSLWAWRLVPFLFALGILGAAWRVGGLIAGRAGAATAAGLFVLGPPAYRHMAIRGYANHVEVMALVLGALVALGLLARRGRARDALVLGALCGGSVFFAYIGAFVVPAVAIALLWRWPGGRRHPLALLGGAVLGFAPWFVMRALPPDRPVSVDVYGRTVTDLLGAEVGLGERLGVLLGEPFWGNLFAPTFVAQPWVGALWIGAALIGVLALVAAARTDVVARALAAGIGAFVLEWILLAPGLPSWPPPPGGGGDAIHYLVPLVTMLPVAAAALWRPGPLRRLAGPVTGLLALLGVAALGADLASPWDAEPLSRPAVNFQPGAISVSAEVELGSASDLDGDLAEVLGIKPDRLIARRALLASVGRLLLSAVAGWSPEDRAALVPLIERLPIGDERWLFSGIASQSILRTEWPEPLPAYLAPMVEPWPQELRARFLRQARSRVAFEHARTHPDGPPGRLEDLFARLDEEADPLLRGELAWEIGLTAGLDGTFAPSPLDAPARLAEGLRSIASLPQDLAAAGTDGVIDMVVRDRCHEAAPCDALRTAVQADHPDAVGFFEEAACAHHLRCGGAR